MVRAPAFRLSRNPAWVLFQVVINTDMSECVKSPIHITLSLVHHQASNLLIKTLVDQGLINSKGEEGM